MLVLKVKPAHMRLTGHLYNLSGTKSCPYFTVMVGCTFIDLVLKQAGNNAQQLPKPVLCTRQCLPASSTHKLTKAQLQSQHMQHWLWEKVQGVLNSGHQLLPVKYMPNTTYRRIVVTSTGPNKQTVQSLPPPGGPKQRHPPSTQESSAQESLFFIP